MIVVVAPENKHRAKTVDVGQRVGSKKKNPWLQLGEFWVVFEGCFPANI